MASPAIEPPEATFVCATICAPLSHVWGRVSPRICRLEKLCTGMVILQGQQEHWEEHEVLLPLCSTCLRLWQQGWRMVPNPARHPRETTRTCAF